MIEYLFPTGDYGAQGCTIALAFMALGPAIGLIDSIIRRMSRA